MKSSIMLFVALCAMYSASAQNSITTIVKDAESKERIAGVVVNIVGTQTGVSSDTSGIVTLSDIPNGRHAIRFTSVGYRELVDSLSFPVVEPDTLTVYLEKNAEEMDEV